MPNIWAWVSENSSGLGVFLSLGTMIVWIAYFQILYLSFSRQRRTKILVNRGVGQGIDSRCLISNMGAEPLYVVSIISILHEGSEKITAAITDLDETEVSEVKHAREASNQGPLMSGSFMDIGQFSSLMARCARSHGRSTEDIESRFEGLEILVIGAYGAEDLSVGATRSFSLSGEAGNKTLTPRSISTQQMRSRRDRKKIEKYLEDQMRSEKTDA